MWLHWVDDVLDSIKTGLLLLDKDLHLKKANLEALQILGIRIESVEEIRFSDWCKGVRIDFPDDTWSSDRNIRIPEQTWTIDGKKVTVEGNVAILRVLGQSVGFLVQFNDSSLNRHIQEELIRSEKMLTLGYMAAGTVHEIRNPLTTVKGFLQLFEKDVRKMTKMGQLQNSFSDRLNMVFPLIFTEIHRIEKILEDMVAMSRQEEMHLEVISLQDVFRAVIPILQEDALERSVTLWVQFPKKQRQFLGSEQSIQQVLLDVVRNALEAVGEVEDPQVKITTQIQDDTFIVEVDDNGPGIPDSILGKIFEPFVSGKDAKGLSLSIAQKVLGAMGGSIQLETQVEIGTKVLIQFPLIKPYEGSLQEELVLDKYTTKHNM